MASQSVSLMPLRPCSGEVCADEPIHKPNEEDEHTAGGHKMKLTDLCNELGVEVVDTRLQHKRGPGQTCAAGTLEQIMREHGSEHLRSVLISIMQSENNRMALVRPVLLAVSDLLRVHPTWFGEDWLKAFDEIDLCQLYDQARKRRNLMSTRQLVGGMIFERVRPSFDVEPRLV
ncbi:MAG: hypothetical protein NVS3B5_02160 [Sphingomicrobium sp.]